MEQEILNQNRKYFSKLGLRYLIGTALIFGVQIGAGIGLSKAAPELYEKYGFLIIMLAMYLIAVPIMILLIKQIPVQHTPEKKKLGFGAILGCFAVAYAAMYIFNIFGNILAGIISALKHGEVTNSIMQVATSNDLWVNFLIMVICAPIVEELLFRKLLIDRTCQYGERFSILLSALLFGLYHGNIYQFCYAFAIGCVFAYVYIKTGNIIHTMILHAMINFMGSILAVLVIKVSGMSALIDGSISNPEEMMPFIMNHLGGIAIFGLFFLFIISLMITGIVLFFVNLKKLNFAPAAEPIAKGHIFKTVALNPGMGLFLVFWIVYMIVATLM